MFCGMITKKKYKNLLKGVWNSEKDTNNFLHLTVNENQLSDNANRLLSSKLSERYFFGGGDSDRIIDFGSYTFRGLPEVDNLVNEAKKELLRMSCASAVNMNCFSGLHAMMCAILVTSSPGDVIMSIPFNDGGHAATKGIIENIGRKHVFAKFDVKNLDFNFKKTVDRFKAANAKVIYIDISVHLNFLDIRKLRRLLPDNAIIIYDASHSLGLILGGCFPSPLKQGADIVCSNTHKTFAGPQSGIILYKDKKIGEKANWTIDTTFVSSVHTARIMALSASILEHAKFGKNYAKQVIANSNALAKILKKRGYKLRKSNNGSYSNNEQVHLFIDNIGERMDLYKKLITNNISTNFMQILGGRTFARLGTQEVTRRGMKVKDMGKIALFLDQALQGKNVKKEVIRFNEKFPNIAHSFDTPVKVKIHE